MRGKYKFLTKKWAREEKSKYVDEAVVIKKLL